eukprot:SAG11_NODE_116_length_16002_cov_19.164560_6_plen_143_part_00
MQKRRETRSPWPRAESNCACSSFHLFCSESASAFVAKPTKLWFSFATFVGCMANRGPALTAGQPSVGAAHPPFCARRAWSCLRRAVACLWSCCSATASPSTSSSPSAAAKASCAESHTGGAGLDDWPEQRSVYHTAFQILLT